MDASKFFTIFFSGLAVFVLGCAIYFVVNFARVYPPMKEYTYACPISDVKSQIHSIVEFSGYMNYEKRDSFNHEDRFREYMVITSISEEYHYYFSIRLIQDKTEKITEIGIIQTLDYKNQRGGYKLSDEGVDSLILWLEASVLKKINDY